MADQSFSVIIVLKEHYKYSQADVAHNSVNQYHNEQITDPQASYSVHSQRSHRHARLLECKQQLGVGTIDS